MSKLLLLRENEVRAAMDMASCLDAVEAAFASYSSGGAELPAVIHLDVPEREAEIHVKAGYLHDGPYYAVKFASGFPRNEGVGLPPNGGMVMVFDAKTGLPAALLLDNGAITDLRTGAAGGVAARHRAAENVTKVAVIGTGAQALYQLDALALVRRFSEVRVWGRDPDHTRACVGLLRGRDSLPEGAVCAVVPSARDAVTGAQVVITCTAARNALVMAEWLSAGAHVTAIGSDGPGKQELDPTILSDADLLVVDSLPQCAQRGELQHALSTGLLTEGDVYAELGEIAAHAKPGRTSEEQLTVCDLTGVGVQDVAAATVVVGRAIELGYGERLTF